MFERTATSIYCTLVLALVGKGRDLTGEGVAAEGVAVYVSESASILELC